ncbi:HDOD domain-containing protein [Marinobacter oulmenensis]|uniref:HD-like signal output (HDOD) protein n=1 Tax=Marinobacter oulmenensis TaxID=643747 RepID=A0A840UQ09_9GAMM|nr:HDOD domain-containing protein [Marinobacter oulmenensis]MBB5322688.1 HD-like signal output (HDOD) protein [Marinobacter oulmenensis]
MGGRPSLPLRRLRAFKPLGRLTDDQLVLLASRAERRSYGAGQRVMERGVKDGLDYFLISGVVELESMDGRKDTIEADTDRALTPVARLQPRMYDVKAVQPCEFLVIDQDILNDLLGSAPVVQTEVHSGDDGTDGSAEQHMLMEFYSELRSNQVRLPSVPDVAWKVRRVVDRENSTAGDVATAVSADPSMAAKLIRACNSPIYRGYNDVRNVREAVVRLGTHTTRQLVTLFAMREVFKTRQPQLQREMDRLWQHSREVAALSRVLADHLTRIDSEEAMLAGLLHDIGVVPVLVHAEHHTALFANEDNLQHAINELRADMGGAVLDAWAFSDAFVEVARHAWDWHYEGNQAEPSLADVVIVAQLHALGATDEPGVAVPAFEQVPAWHRLGKPDLHASSGLQLLNEARERVDEVKALLSIR